MVQHTLYRILKKWRENMASRFMRVDEVARELDVSEAYAYKIIKKLNNELSEMGYITVAGKLNRDYFNKRVYSAENNTEEKEG